MSDRVAAVVLAAGEGKRMKSRLVKTAHKIAGVSIVRHVVRAAHAVGAGRVVVIIGKDAEQVQAAAGAECQFAVQYERQGTGHACQQAEDSLRGFEGTIFVLCGDAPLISPATLANMLEIHRTSGAVGTILTARPAEVRGLGRIKRDSAGNFLAIVEEKDATPEEKDIREINAGFYCFESRHLWDALRRIDNNNAQKEYMLTDVFKFLREAGPVATVATADFEETIGINDRVWLAKAEQAFQKRKQQELMFAGVTIVSPESTYIEADVAIGQDTIIWPNSVLKGSTTIGSECEIGPGTTVEDSTIMDGAVVTHSFVAQSIVGREAHVGPFAHLRPQSELGDHVKVGNFVEVKKSTVGDGTKISHLAYVGDAVIGKKANLGAGTIIVNYDGVNKHQTIIGDGAFVGCNANLVAPITIGEESFVAAGSTITKNVPPRALAVGRARQENKEGWVSRHRQS